MDKNRQVPHTGGEALAPGTVLLGRYHIDRVLGQGGFGITYAALDLHTQTAVAVKELFPSGFVTRQPDGKTLCIYPGREDAVSDLLLRFQQEAQTLMTLQGRAGVLRVTHLFHENRSAYYVMELLTGMDLSHWLTCHGTMTWPQLLPILHPLMQALEQIHHAGLIHRDVSPDNIFLCTDGSVRLIDFGSVRAYQGGDHFTALLKHGFAPWEQYLTTGSQGPWTDVYALCVTAYFALTGQKPPPATERRIHDTLVPLQFLAPYLPKSICQALTCGMAVLPEERYQSIRQLRSALMGLAPPASPAAGTLVCLRGIMAGNSWQIPPGGALRIGRNPDCHVVYPKNAPGVSHYQCVIARTKSGQLLVRDEGSSCGTTLAGNGATRQLFPGTWHPLDGLHICFGQQEEYAEAGR